MFFNKANKSDKYNIDDYKDMHSFAKKWQYDFAAQLNCSEDEGYYEACAYWRKYSKYEKQ